ncbi:MAG: NUDIX hydrolase [Bacteroidia bacterium]|nr:NUDIX hydrolase [Bacteroidia bacterium]MDW8157594.1 NUDIX hydrolase [Bacteroidia bacterium]
MENLENSLKFKSWLMRLQKAGLELRKYQELATVRKKNGEVLFSFLDTKVWDKELNRFLPGYLVLRGNFVSVLTCLTEKATSKRYLLLVCQRRIGNGEVFFEHPCGMCDNQQDIYTVALQELREETGLEIDREQLILLNAEPYYTSPGLLDEGGYFFCCELVLESSEIWSLAKQRRGESIENEYIITQVVELEEAPRLMRNANALLNYYLYLEYKNKHY